MSDLRNPPEDFRIMAAKMGMKALQRHYSSGWTTVNRWFRETESERRPGRGLTRPIPDNFAELAATMTKVELRREYRVHDNTIIRWLRETGLTAQRYVRTPPTPHRGPQPHRKAARWVTYGAPHAVKVDTARDTSLEGLAAEHLRCATRAPIYRCTERGIADPQGPCWRYGNVVLSPAELYERAHRHGFEARRFAA